MTDPDEFSDAGGCGNIRGVSFGGAVPPGTFQGCCDSRNAASNVHGHVHEADLARDDVIGGDDSALHADFVFEVLF